MNDSSNELGVADPERRRSINDLHLIYIIPIVCSGFPMSKKKESSSANPGID
jgi:hypothetical protein